MDELTADAILGQLRRLRTSRQAQPAEEYRQAAAVLAALSKPEDLHPVSGSFTPGAGVAALGGDLVKAPEARLGGRLMLTHEARRAALKSLGSREQMLKALEANPAERVGPVQQQFENYLSGKAKPLPDQNRAELECTLQALLWLHDIVPALPDINEVRNLLAWRDFVEPFETLAGDNVFRGRVAELEDLRNYVGVLAPSTLRGRLNRIVSNVRPTSRVLSVFGPGGVGKSALIARFILEHSRLPFEMRIPVAYLDFDRSTLNVTEHRPLLEEILRQLILQFPDQAEFRNLRTSVPPVPSDAYLKSGGSSMPPSVLNLEHVLNDLMRAVQRVLPGRPFVLILDTFEQVQYLGESRALSLWQILAKVQERFPILRIVVSGRAPVSTLRMGGELPEQLEVGDLDTAAAVAFVQASGGFAPATAEAIVRAVGGVPLSLKLASRLLHDDPDADINVGSRFWLRTADEVIQGQLFDRILGQIRDQQIRRVAHPGLVLRRITPDVLQEVLNEPCNLGITTLAEAMDLFARLQSEVSLVATADDGDGALVHRRELREVMLKLLRQREPAIVDDISRRGVEYYGTQSGTRARMEHVYHQLLLKEPIDKVVFNDREIRASIQASMPELPLESQQLLASYGFQVDASVLQKATNEQRESAIAEFVEQMLPHGAEGFAQARSRLEGLGTIDHDSPLWRALARLRFEAGDPEGATETLAHGLRLAIVASNSFRVLELLSDQAWQYEARFERASLEDSLKRLVDYAGRHDDTTAGAQWFLQAGRLKGDWFPSKTEGTTAERVFQRLRPRDFFGLMPATRGFWTVAASSGMPGRLFADLVLNPESNFESVVFPGRPQAQLALQRVSRHAYDTHAESSGDWSEFAAALEALATSWPYRNLHVHPPQADARQFAR